MAKKAETVSAKKAGRPTRLGGKTPPTPQPQLITSRSVVPAPSETTVLAPQTDANVDDILAAIPISQLTIDVPIINRPIRKVKLPPFRFLDLPSEIRLKVYSLHFTDVSSVIDLEPENYSRIHKKLGLLRTCRTIYAEASHQFYSTRSFRIFPTHGRFTKTKKPLLARLKSHQRAWMTSLELRIGPGFNKPYRSWVVNTALGLKECVNIRHLTVFVECDPSDRVFEGFRKLDGFYEIFSRNLLNEVLNDLPSVRTVTFDAHSYVKKSGDMMQGLLRIARSHGREIGWGEERGWTDEDEVEREIPVGPTRNIVWGMGGPLSMVALTSATAAA